MNYEHFSKIDENLWMGGTPAEWESGIPEHIQFIVNLYPWGQYDLYQHQVMTVTPMYDSEVIPDRALLELLADHVNACRKHGDVLVHCQQGWNRSGLVTALAMIRGGMEASTAIHTIRTKRNHMCLSNRAFHDWLVRYEVTA